MEPRIVLQVNLRLCTSKHLRGPQASGTFRRWLQRRFPGIFWPKRWVYQSRTVNVWAQIHAPATEVGLIVSSVKRVQGPDGCVYEIDNWKYLATENTYVGQIDLCERVTCEDHEDTAQALERHLLADYLSRGFKERMPGREATTYRTARLEPLEAQPPVRAARELVEES